MVYLQPFRRNSVLKCALHPKIAKNSLKTRFGGVQGRSRSSMLINLKSLSLVLVTISSMFVTICNRFHTIQANNGKTTFLRRYQSLTPSFEGNPSTQGHEILSRKTRHLVAAHGEDFVIRACTVLIAYSSRVCQTDRQTDRRPGHS